MASSRNYWHFHYGKINSVVLGPHLRALEMAKAANACGLEANLILDDASGVQIPGVRQISVADFSMDRIRPHDAVVVSDAAAARIPWRLARRKLAFHADSYGMALPELVKIYPSWSVRRAWTDRIRRCLKFEFISHFAEKIYLSHDAQLFLLAGTVFSGRNSNDASVADSLTEKVLYVPMGVSKFEKDIDLPNPYPADIQSRRIFLWGGGIWAWFDTDTLIRAFELLRDTDAVLFFISGKDHSGLPLHQKALESAKSLAAELGLLGRNIFFNEKPVGPIELPGYIQHAWAGVMANPSCLEAQASWRTRYLDLLAGGIPLVVSGSDPLAVRMATCGAALLSHSGDVLSLAENIRRLSKDECMKRSMGLAAHQMGADLHWDRTLAPFRKILTEPSSFSPPNKTPHFHWLVRYAFAPYVLRWLA